MIYYAGYYYNFNTYSKPKFSEEGLLLRIIFLPKKPYLCHL